MRKFSRFSFHFFQARIWKPYALSIKTIAGILLFTLIFQSTSFGQSANIDQIRNSNTYPGNTIPLWVNGNAGSSNSHYAEGMSIAYRTLLTNLTIGKTYTLIIGYDTKHSDAMAIDYLTHYQRLEPHGPFGHPAEVVNPLHMQSGSVQYDMTAGAPSTHPFPIPDPIPAGYWDNADNGILHPPNPAGADDGTPVDNQPKNSFNALNNNAGEPNDNVMTIWNGTITSMNYIAQPSLVTSDANTQTQLRIKLVASSDSVLLAWGGHIGSRLDWGFFPGTTTPRSAGGISGSPYHMALLQLFVYNGTPIGNKTCNKDSCEVGLGNQDRSLSAAAVFPPPECPVIPNQTICVGGATSMVFTIPSPQAGAVYTWSFGSNGVDAAFPGNVTSVQGTSVTVVHNGGGSFTSTGSFSLDITAVLNAVPQICPGVATGFIEKTVVSASANPTTIVITSAAHNTTLTADITGSSDTDPANYTYQWSILAGAGSLSNTTARVTTYTAAVADAGSTVRFQVTATHKTGAQCAANTTVSAEVSSVGQCDVSPQAAVCQNTTTTHNGSPNPKSADATYVWSLEAYGGGGSTTATLLGGNSGGVSQSVVANASYRIKLTQTYANTALNTSCFEDVTVIPTPTVTSIYFPPGCTDQSFKINIPSSLSTSNYTVTQGGGYNQTKPGNNGTLEFTGLALGGGYTVTVSTNTAGCTATTDCGSSSSSCNGTVVQKNGNTNTSDATVKPSETYKINLESPTDVTAVPNPFTDRIRFSMRSAVSGKGSLELYNVMGQKVGVVYEGYFQAGQEFTKDFNVKRGSTATLIYVFKVGDQKVTGKLISLK